LDKNQKVILKNKRLLDAVEALSEIISRIESSLWENRATAAAKEVSEMSEENRRMMLMGAKEREFFIEFSKNNPDNKWDYFKEYQKMKSEKYVSR